MKQPLVSVIIPVYNNADNIKKLIPTILKSGYKNLEIILVDDGSTDDGLTLCKQFAKKSTKVKVFHQSNHGASSARNLGIQKSSGELLCFVDADDSIATNFISTLVNLITKPNTALAGTGMLRHRLQQNTSSRLYAKPLRIQKPNESRQDYILWLMLQDGRLYPVANKIFHAAPIKKHHLKFNENINFAEDTEFVLSYLAITPGTIRFTTKPLYIYNLDTANGTVGKSSLDWKNWQQSYRFIKHWLKNPTFTTHTRLKLLLLRWHISHALAHLRNRKS